MTTIYFDRNVRFNVINGYLVPFEDEEGQSEFEVVSIDINNDGLCADIDIDLIDDDMTVEPITDVDIIGDDDEWYGTIWVNLELMKEFWIRIE